METLTVIAAVAIAAVFVGWRVIATLRLAGGKGDAHACHKCPAARQ